MGFSAVPSAAETSMAAFTPPQPAWDVRRDRMVSQLLLHLLLNSKQSLPSVRKTPVLNFFLFFITSVSLASLCLLFFFFLCFLFVLVTPERAPCLTPECRHFDPEGEQQNKQCKQSAFRVLVAAQFTSHRQVVSPAWGPRPLVT